MDPAQFELGRGALGVEFTQSILTLLGQVQQMTVLGQVIHHDGLGSGTADDGLRP